VLRSTGTQVGILPVSAFIALLSASSHAMALEPKKEEAKVLEDCDRRLCTMILRKEHTGEDLKCDLTKTWVKSTIKGADSPSLKSFGDARCSLHLNITRASIVAALTAEQYKLWVPAHTAECLIEHNGEVTTIKVRVERDEAHVDGCQLSHEEVSCGETQSHAGRCRHAGPLAACCGDHGFMHRSRLVCRRAARSIGRPHGCGARSRPSIARRRMRPTVVFIASLSKVSCLALR